MTYMLCYVLSSDAMVCTDYTVEVTCRRGTTISGVVVIFVGYTAGKHAAVV